MIFTKPEIETKARKKCAQCHIYLPDNCQDLKCDYCLGRKIRIENPEPVKHCESCTCHEVKITNDMIDQFVKNSKKKKCRNCRKDLKPNQISQYCRTCLGTFTGDYY